jgi:hypothetical protein
MIVKCPNCQVRLRSTKVDRSDSLLILCPGCQTRFRVLAKKVLLQAFIAHEDQEVCQQLSERVSALGGVATVCRDTDAITAQLQDDQCCVLLLDVAFNGTFPFQLIDKINASDNYQHKVVLLPSVYNRTAYKKRPDSLYGADAYLELHHIGDRLVPLLTDLFPSLAQKFKPVAPVCTQGDERILHSGDVSGQADKLAKLLVADILLYHQDQLEQGLVSGQLEQLFSEQLAEGRRLLASRLPAVADLSVDYIQQAFDAACQSYSRG